MRVTENPSVDDKINAYPASIAQHLLALRQAVFDVAKSIEDTDELVEILKWNEASYTCRRRSTVPLDWKPPNPERCAMCCNCSTRLIKTFRVMYPEEFTFQGNRALLFNVNKRPSMDAVRHCIHSALRYHELNKLPSLGMWE